MPNRITEEILAAIVGIAADAVICIDESQHVTFFNTGAETIFGWTRDEIIGQRLEVLIPERYRRNHAHQVEQFGRSGVTARRMGERREIAGLRKGGIEFPAEAAISQLRQDGRVVYAVVLRDVTFRKRFERRQEFLAAAGEALASSFGSGEVLHHVVTLAVPTLADGAILENRSDDGFSAGATAHSDPRVSESLERIATGEVRRPPEGHPLTEILRTRTRVLIQPDAATAIISRSASAMYIEAIKAVNPMAALFVPLVARGQLIGALSLFRSDRLFDNDDVLFAEDLGRLAALALDNSRLHEAVRVSLRAREEMVGVVSHDLRNPVAAVKMLSRAILTESGNDTKSSESLSLIAQAAELMDTLIRDLLDLTRIDAGKLRIAAEATDASALLTHSLQTLLPLIEEKHIHLDMQLEVGLPRVLADDERIQQALSNLVGNAIKFTPEGGKIAVTASREAQVVLVSVLDSGPGIPEDHLPKVFDRYWQSTRTNRQGAGLGLAIAKGIIEGHGGRIWIESSPGKGTAARFTLPIVTDPSTH